MVKTTTLHHILYKTTNIITGGFYIGIHSTKDLNDGYLGSGKILWNSIRKYGKDVHRAEILETFQDRLSLVQREEEIVNEELLADPLCMNIAYGGYGGMFGRSGEQNIFYGRKHTEETKKKISERLLGKPLPSETRKKMSASRKGKVQYSRPVMANGVRYESIRSAAIALNMDPTTLANWIKKSKPKYAEFYFVDTVSLSKDR